MAYQNYRLQARSFRGESWDVLQKLDGSGDTWHDVRARTVKEALAKVHRSPGISIMFQPGFVLRLCDAEGNVVAEQTDRDDDAETVILTLIALGDRPCSS